MLSQLMLRTLAVVTILLLGTASAQTTSPHEDNRELRQLIEQDQRDRLEAPRPPAEELLRRDADRRSQVLELIRAGRVRTPGDYYNASFLFHHGPGVFESRLAYSLAWTGVSLDPDDERLKWLAMSAWDRMMIKQGRPQLYGTQSVRDAGGQWSQGGADWRALSEEDRKFFGLPRVGNPPTDNLKARSK